MHTIYKSAIVPYSTSQMFDLVNDINNYPRFLNWCSDSSILEQNYQKIIASIKINKGFFQQEFTTINLLETNKKIVMELQKGPFKTFNGKWVFNLLSKEVCKIEFHLNFIFSSKIIDISLSPIFSAIANSQLESFIKRAKEVYG